MTDIHVQRTVSAASGYLPVNGRANDLSSQHLHSMPATQRPHSSKAVWEQSKHCRPSPDDSLFLFFSFLFFPPFFPSWSFSLSPFPCVSNVLSVLGVNYLYRASDSSIASVDLPWNVDKWVCVCVLVCVCDAVLQEYRMYGHQIGSPFLHLHASHSTTGCWVLLLFDRGFTYWQHLRT